LDLFGKVLAGEAGAALSELASQYADGADPLAILKDMAEITHWVSVVKISPETAQDPTVSPDERERGLGYADKVPMRVLSRMWQMLLKALEEVGSAPRPLGVVKELLRVHQGEEAAEPKRPVTGWRWFQTPKLRL